MRHIRLYDPNLDCAYHCGTRLHPRHSDFSVDDLIAFREILEATSVFAGVGVLTFALLPRRIELLVKVQARRALDDTELLRRARAGLGPEKAELLSEELAADSLRSAAGRDTRSRLTKRMFDLPAFMKDLKQRCSAAYLGARGLKGGVWANVYSSMPTENRREVLAEVAALVDGWVVWEGAARHPQEYPFCGFGEAAAGSPAFRRTFSELCGKRSWPETVREYAQRIAAAERPRRYRNMARVHGNLPAETILRTVRAQWHRKHPDGVTPRRTEKQFLKDLRSFQKKFGHCKVTAKWVEDPALGRWVLALRGRRENGLLGEELIAKLDRLGFQWERVPRGRSGVRKPYVSNRDNINARWETQFENLLDYLAEHGHMRVPRGNANGERDRRLCLWIMVQRDKARNGTIRPERKARLDAVDFDWNS